MRRVDTNQSANGASSGGGFGSLGMSFCELDKLVLTDDDLVSAGYRAHPFDKDGNYVGAPTVRAPERTISKGPRNMTRAPNFTGTA